MTSTMTVRSLRLFYVSVVSLLAIAGLARTAAAQPVDTSFVRADTVGQLGSIVVIARSNGDSMVVRWAPVRPALWSEANARGYIIERARVDEHPPEGFVYTRLSPQPLRPWSAEEWTRRGAASVRWMQVASEMLYGAGATLAEMEVDPGSAQAIDVQARELESRHGFALFAADIDAGAATGLALRFVDRDVVQGATYVYQISVAGGSVGDTADVFVMVAKPEYDPMPLQIIAESEVGAIRTEWRDDPDEGYSGYWLDRSSDNGRTWQRLTGSPIVRIRSGEENSLQLRTIGDSSNRRQVYVPNRESALVAYRDTAVRYGVGYT